MHIASCLRNILFVCFLNEYLLLMGMHFTQSIHPKVPVSRLRAECRHTPCAGSGMETPLAGAQMRVSLGPSGLLRAGESLWAVLCVWGFDEAALDGAELHLDRLGHINQCNSLAN